MTHDPLCPSAYTMQCECDLIFRVREDERESIRQPGRLAELIAAEREAMRAACISAVRQRRDEFVAQVASRPLQTKSLISVAYEDAIFVLREVQP